MSNARQRPFLRLDRWLEPQLFQPFVFGILVSLSLSEFVRGALTLSLLPTYGRTVLEFAVEWTALSLSIHYLVDNILRAPAGWLADRIGQRTVLLVGFAIAVASVVWMMHARSISTLILSLAAYGVGVCPVWPAAVSGIGLATPDKKRAAFMGYLYIFWLAGTGLGPVVINFVIGKTYTLAFWVLIAVDVIGFVLVWWLVRQPRAVQATEAKVRLEGRNRRAYFLSLWGNIKDAAFLFPGMFAQTFAVASLIPILSLYARVVLHISGALYSSILVAGGAFTVVLLIPAGKIVDRYGPRRFLVIAFLIAGSALGIYPFFHTLPMTYAVVCVLGICYAFILPAWNSVLDKSIDPDKKGTLWGVFMTVEGLGSAVGPYLGGLVWDTISPKAPFWVSAGVILTLGLLYLVLPIDATRRRPQGPQRSESARGSERPATSRGLPWAKDKQKS